MTLRQNRRGFTLIELMIVLAIIVALAALGLGSLRELVPRFKARRAAYDLAADLSKARELAILNNRETQVTLVDWDPTPADMSAMNAGAWTIAIGNRAMGSTKWDILPFDSESDGVDDFADEGVYDLSRDGEQFQRYVSMVEPDVQTITFNPRGWLANDSTDLLVGGFIQVKFANKVALANGVEDYWLVRVYRGGVVRVEPAQGEGYENDDAGLDEHTTTSSNTSSSSATSGTN